MKAGKLTYGVYLDGYCVSRHKTEGLALDAIYRRQQRGESGRWSIHLSALNRVGWAHF